MTVAEVAKRMLDTYPRDYNVDQAVLVRCIDACADCASAWTQCADDCLSEQGHVEQLAKCIRLNLDCADVCAATERIISRQTEYDANITRTILEACAQVCRSCAEECATHGRQGMEHCSVCAAECRRCTEACEELLAAIA